MSAGRILARYGSLILIFMLLGFIWGNSSLPADRSTELSSGLLAWLTAYVPGLGWLFEGLLRKLAHFLEFAALGGAICLDCRSWNVRLDCTMLLTVLGCFLTACVDETIQLFVPGRSSSVVDVWIDGAGGLTGLLACLLMLHLWCRCYQKRKCTF